MYDSKINYGEKALEMPIDYNSLIEFFEEERDEFLNNDSGFNGGFASTPVRALSVKIELLKRLCDLGITCLVEIPDIRKMGAGIVIPGEDYSDICRELLYNIIEDSMLSVRNKIDHLLKIIGESESVSSKEGKQRMKKLVRDAFYEIILTLRENNELEWI